jgi:hypothetical protein
VGYWVKYLHDDGFYNKCAYGHENAMSSVSVLMQTFVYVNASETDMWALIVETVYTA